MGTNSDGNGTQTINVADAAIQTATVEVQTLTVGGKQMTIAVFRQLLSEPVLDRETLQTRGKLWGFVNHHTSACPVEEHLHVVWERDGQLRKATVLSYAAYKPAGHDWRDWELCYQAVYVYLRSLNQLFIAV